jgi:hypothetical protein
MFRFTLPITIGAFFGAMDVWDWHWHKKDKPTNT